MDGNREIRAMLFSCLHLPPLPALMQQVECDEHRIIGEGVESSHALIGNLIEWMGMARDHTQDGQRMAQQFEMLARFRGDISGLDLGTCSDESLYELYCHHTRLWLGCYTKAGHATCFKPLDYVTNGDKFHRNMADYCKAQYHHFTEGRESLTLEASVPYRDMLRKCAEWTQAAYGQADV